MNSLRKGKRFERECARRLNELTGYSWHRVPQSGAMATRLSKEELYDPKFNGDIFCEMHPYSQWVVECKVTKQPLTIQELTNGNSKLWTWWLQTVEETPKTHHPVLLFKWARSQIYFLTESDMLLLHDDIFAAAKPVSLGVAMILGVLPREKVEE